MTAARDLTLEFPSMSEKVSPAEWEARVALAACYRLAAHFGWTSRIHNHISLRVPDQTDHFLINPFGLMYEEITASSLIKIDPEGRVVDETSYTVNEAGFVIHGAVHRARPDINCVIHTHTNAGVAVSALECGLLPINQTAMMFYNRLGYHDFEGVAVDADECDRLARDLGGHYVMMLRNHGLLTAGRTVAEAFVLMDALDKSCAVQLQVQATGEKIILPTPELCERTAQRLTGGGNVRGGVDWPALLRLADRLDPSYAD